MARIASAVILAEFILMPRMMPQRWSAGLRHGKLEFRLQPVSRAS
jgi:hypothetical protein